MDRIRGATEGALERSADGRMRAGWGYQPDWLGSGGNGRGLALGLASPAPAGSDYGSTTGLKPAAPSYFTSDRIARFSRRSPTEGKRRRDGGRRGGNSAHLQNPTLIDLTIPSLFWGEAIIASFMLRGGVRPGCLVG